MSKGNLKSLYTLDSVNNILYIMMYHCNSINEIFNTSHIDLKTYSLKITDCNKFRECKYNLYEIYKRGMECE